MHKVKRSVTPQVQGSKSGAAGSASVQVSRAGRSNNMQLQPPPTRSGPAHHNAAINATCIRAMFVGKMVDLVYADTHAHTHKLMHTRTHRYMHTSTLTHLCTHEHPHPNTRVAIYVLSSFVHHTIHTNTCPVLSCPVKMPCSTTVMQSLLEEARSI